MYSNNYGRLVEVRTGVAARSPVVWTGTLVGEQAYYDSEYKDVYFVFLLQAKDGTLHKHDSLFCRFVNAERVL